ncbi:MAG: acyl-CoA dehydrogenase domain-containing protein [Rhodocyclaceae bacterium]|nr:MAG: acyl-CoA dehydrogenase domain-containing protein [Rhodocyclaceae bacterium]TND00072.1 MAG: acyl-CoA dehydrogenase domain-containing protein [Rhodocyclaceae bacterium]
MSSYAAPLKDMHFVLTELAGLDKVAALPGYEEATEDVVGAILDESAKFTGGVLDPLNYSGDQEGAKWADRSVTMPKGFKEAYRQFVDNGWNALSGNPEHGGQGLPKVVSAAVQEMWKSANISFSLCPLLTLGAIEALELAGNDQQKAMYLPNMISGNWTGTMNITEPQAGSDLAAIRSRAVPQGDGTYRIFGQKIFITYGDHDMAENTIHLVLARTPDAPEGVKGISLFVVPKFLVNPDGSLGARNDAYCVSIEHKLGIHASPTCVMALGDNGGAIGTLVGQENQGLKYMFVMMNAARFAVGLEGLAIAERAYQHAVAYARDRVQGRAIEGSASGVAIIKHPDIRRMLMLMRANVEAMRALAYSVASAHDAAARHPDAAKREQNQAYVDLMIPVVKGWSTETGNEMAYLGVQVHGGMGFIEETGAAQYMRDARITTIYEGTTGIQANDLMGRKIAREGGATIKAVLGTMQQTRSELAQQTGAEFVAIAAALGRGIEALQQATDYIVANYGKDVRAVAAGAVPFLRLMGVVSGGWMMARAALVAQGKIAGGDADPFFPAKIATAHFYADHVMASAAGLAQEVVQGGASALALDEAMF